MSLISLVLGVESSFLESQNFEMKGFYFKFMAALLKVAGEPYVDSVMGELNVFLTLSDLVLLKLPMGLPVLNIFKLLVLDLSSLKPCMLEFSNIDAGIV